MFLVIERNNFSNLSPTWWARDEKRDYSSPFRVVPGADWMYYDPIASRAIDEAEAGPLATGVRPPIPDGHLIGFNVDLALDRWINGQYR